MQHARKMVLVPHESVTKLQEQKRENDLQDEVKNLSTVQTPGSYLTRLDTQMSEILNSQIDERDKWQQYQQILQRYLSHLNNLKNPDSIKEVKDQIIEYGIPTANILESVPSKYRRRAGLLLNLFSSPNIRPRITWDERGVVSIDGKNIVSSNIIDLINDSQRARKGIRAVGRDIFSAFLQDIGIPYEYIGNSEFLNNGQSLYTSSPIVPQRTGNVRTALDDSFNYYTPKAKQLDFNTPESTLDTSRSVLEGTIKSITPENVLSIRNKKPSSKKKKRKSPIVDIQRMTTRSQDIQKGGSRWLKFSI